MLVPSALEKGLLGSGMQKGLAAATGWQSSKWRVGIMVALTAGCAATMLFAIHTCQASLTAEGGQRVVELMSPAPDNDGCGAILHDAILEKVKRETVSSDSFMAEQLLMAFDEHYSYDDYTREWRKAGTSSKNLPWAFGASSSFKAISASVSGSSLNSRFGIDRAQFDMAKKEKLLEKRALEDLSSEPEWEADVAEIVSREAMAAWKDCKRLASSNIHTLVDADPSGRHLSIALKYVLGDGPGLMIKPKLVELDIVPPGAAYCHIINSSGLPVEHLPLDLPVGMPVHVSCFRNATADGRVSIFVATNVVQETMRANFVDVVTQVLAEDVQNMQQQFVSKYDDIMDELASISGRLGGAEGRLGGAEGNISSIKSRMNNIDDALKAGVCRLCYDGCGDGWLEVGYWLDRIYVAEFDNECSGTYTDRANINPSLCCNMLQN